jgi:hypothetical protein
MTPKTQGENLIDLLKNEMGYTEVTKNCKGCIHSVEESNPHLDRDWILVCKLNTIKMFSVKPVGRCKYWKPKDKT